MNKIFCTNCGNKMESVVAINFCSKCGQALNGKRNVQNTAPVAQAEVIDEDYVDTESRLDISALKDKIRVSVDFEAAKPIKIGEYLEMAKASGPTTETLSPRRSDNLPNGKDLLKKIADECSTSRNKSSEVE